MLLIEGASAPGGSNGALSEAEWSAASAPVVVDPTALEAVATSLAEALAAPAAAAGANTCATPAAPAADDEEDDEHASHTKRSSELRYALKRLSLRPMHSKWNHPSQPPSQPSMPHPCAAPPNRQPSTQ